MSHTSVGFPRASITFAMVKVLPEPVTPNKVLVIYIFFCSLRPVVV